MQSLIKTEAWTDAALALIALELPQWKVRRLVREDGEWICTLSRHYAIPDWLDDTTEARHEVLPLAILSALVEARRDLASSAACSKAVPRVGSMQGLAACCDNFA